MKTEVSKRSNGSVKSAAFGAIEQVLISGDLAPLSSEQRVEYYNAVCKAVGLNPLTKPFDYIQLNSKLQLYANKGCAEQLRANRKISITVKDAKQMGDVYLVVVEASDDKGRVDSSTGAVSTKGLAGDALANAFMKCETKAKRRVTLSICGLNMLDETETETIPGHGTTVDRAPAPTAPATIAPPKTPGPEAQKASDRAEIAKEINAARKTLKLSVEEVQDWSKNMTGKEKVADLTIVEMQNLLADLQKEVGRM